MTAIALWHYQDRIEIAADSGIFWGGHGMKEDTSVKIKSPRDDLWIAGTGFCSEINLFDLFCSSRHPEANSRHGVLRFFSEFIAWKKTFSEKTTQENTYFLVFKSTPYIIDQGFDVQEIKVSTFNSIGAGMQECKAAMYLGKTPKESVELAIRINTWVSGVVQSVVIQKLGAE